MLNRALRAALVEGIFLIGVGLQAPVRLPNPGVFHCFPTISYSYQSHRLPGSTLQGLSPTLSIGGSETRDRSYLVVSLHLNDYIVHFSTPANT